MDESSETLKAVLRDMGIDDVDTMDAGDIVLLARTLGIEVPGGENDVAGTVGESEIAENDMETETNAEQSESFNTAFIADSSVLNNTVNGLNSRNGAGVNSVAVAPAEEDNSHDGIISAFCDITGSDLESAGHLLEAFGWDLQGAISMYLENPQGIPAQRSVLTSSAISGITGQRVPVHTHYSYDSDNEGDNVPATSGQMEGIGGSDNDVVMPPFPGGRMGTGSMHEQHLNSVLQSMMRSSMGMQSEDSDDHPLLSGPGGIAAFMANYEQSRGGADGRRQADVYDEDGIRMPDPVQRQRLVPTGRNFRGVDDDEPMGRAEDPTVEWMFPPPRHLSSQSSLEKARSQAQAEGRWLLVNIQSHEQFASHMLNRDTWVHETMESVLRTTFLLWQRGHTSEQGAAYMRMHRLAEDDLPHIGVIDPRTGAKLLTLTGFVSPDDLLIRLMEFADRNPLTTPKVSVPSSMRGSAVGSTNISSATSNASSGNNSSLNIEGMAADSKPSGRDRDDASSDSKQGDHKRDSKRGDKAAGGGVGDDRPITGSGAGVTAVSDGQLLGGATVSGGESLKALSDYGPIPDEPADGAEGAIKVSIKLSNGKAYARRYLKSTPVLALFAVAASVDGAARGKQFELLMRFPAPLSLSTCLDKTLDECALAGSQLILQIA